MTVVIGFVIFLMLLFIIYMFHRLYITRKWINIISLGFQICIFTIATLGFVGNVGTSESLEALYLLFGCFLPGGFFAYDYFRMIRRVKQPESAERLIDNTASDIAEESTVKIDIPENTLSIKAEKFVPEEWSTRYNAGVKLYEQGRYAEAVDMFKKALDVKPDEIIIYYHMGCALIEQKRYDEALNCFKRAFGVKLTDSEIYYDIATVYSLIKKYDIAVDALRNAVQLNHDLKIEARYNRAFEPIKKSPEFKRIVS